MLIDHFYQLCNQHGQKHLFENVHQQGIVRAHITTLINTTPEQLWRHISHPRSLQYISAPILHFKPLAGTDISSEWREGNAYAVQLRLLGLLPLGTHRIEIQRLDKNNHVIISRERGTLANVWDHTIRFRSVGSHQVQYEDIVEIQAGLLTLGIWRFAHFFYRHRQRRWHRLLTTYP